MNRGCRIGSLDRVGDSTGSIPVVASRAVWDVFWVDGNVCLLSLRSAIALAASSNAQRNAGQLAACAPPRLTPNVQRHQPTAHGWLARTARRGRALSSAGTAVRAGARPLRPGVPPPFRHRATRAAHPRRPQPAGCLGLTHRAHLWCRAGAGLRTAVVPRLPRTARRCAVAGTPGCCEHYGGAR